MLYVAHFTYHICKLGGISLHIQTLVHAIQQSGWGLRTLLNGTSKTDVQKGGSDLCSPSHTSWPLSLTG